jgi:hypothetical protein
MSLNNLPTTAPTLFVHFKNAATGERLYSQRTVETEGGSKQVDVAIGVHVYTPGSKIYRNAQNMNITANIKAGKKELSGAKLDEQQTDLLARTTFKIEGFELEGGVTVDTLRAFYDNEAYAAYREQVAEEQADLGKSLKPAAKV